MQREEAGRGCRWETGARREGASSVAGARMPGSDSLAGTAQALPWLHLALPVWREGPPESPLILVHRSTFSLEHPPSSSSSSLSTSRCLSWLPVTVFSLWSLHQRSTGMWRLPGLSAPPSLPPLGEERKGESPPGQGSSVPLARWVRQRRPSLYLLPSRSLC